VVLPNRIAGTGPERAPVAEPAADRTMAGSGPELLPFDLISPVRRIRDEHRGAGRSSARPDGRERAPFPGVRPQQRPRGTSTIGLCALRAFHERRVRLTAPAVGHARRLPPE
jgi:hypothetical protein